MATDHEQLIAQLVEESATTLRRYGYGHLADGIGAAFEEVLSPSHSVNEAHSSSESVSEGDKPTDECEHVWMKGYADRCQRCWTVRGDAYIPTDDEREWLDSLRTWTLSDVQSSPRTALAIIVRLIAHIESRRTVQSEPNYHRVIAAIRHRTNEKDFPLHLAADIEQIMVEVGQEEVPSTAVQVESWVHGEPSDAEVIAADLAMLDFRAGTQEQMIREMLRAAAAPRAAGVVSVQGEPDDALRDAISHIHGAVDTATGRAQLQHRTAIEHDRSGSPPPINRMEDAMTKQFTEDDVAAAVLAYGQHVTGYSMQDGGRSYTCRCGWSSVGSVASMDALNHRMREALSAIADQSIGGGE